MKNSRTYDAIIFDLDGTLIDSSPSILNCFGHALSEAGLQPLVPLNDSLIGPPLRQTLINLTGLTDNSLLDRLVDGFKECYDTVGYKATQVYNGVEDMLGHLAECNIPLAIATNKRRVPTMKILEHLGWEKYFRIVGTLDTPLPPYRSKAEMIGSLLRKLEVEAEVSLYVGDKREDGEAAAANAMPFCAVGWGYGEWNRVLLPEEWRLMESAADLVALLSGTPLQVGNGARPIPTPTTDKVNM
ncbi:MAG: HAD family hydrolase [Desulfuromonadales bacterium]|nr:HAD family hydrolase [Desulfuromonadales bacterium]